MNPAQTSPTHAEDAQDRNAQQTSQDADETMAQLHNARFWLAVSVSALSLALLVILTDTSQLIRTLREAQHLQLAPAVALYIAGQGLRTLRWQYLLAPTAYVPTRQLFPVMIVGYAANNILPARLGEVTRAIHLSRRQPSITTAASIATISIERIYDAVALLTIAAIAAPLALQAGLLEDATALHRQTALAAATVTIGALLIALPALTILSASTTAHNALQAGTRHLPARVRQPTQRAVKSFLAAITPLNSPRKHALLLGQSLAIWMTETGVYAIVALSFHLDEHFTTTPHRTMAVALVVVTTNLASAVPTSIGGIGIFEVAAQQTLVALGVPPAIGATYAITLHLAVLWLPVNAIAAVTILWSHRNRLRPSAHSAAPRGEQP